MKLPVSLLLGAALLSADYGAATASPLKATQVSASVAVQQALGRLNGYTAMQKAVNVQNSDLAYAMRKALLMADLLFHADGTLDLTMPAAVKASFISPTPEEYEVNMVHVLNQLNTNWSTFFLHVKAPADQSSEAAFVLRGLFTLPPQQALTDRHARVAVMAAMLAPYDQGPVGDCFAVNDVIRDHEEYFLHAAEDYQSVVMNGNIQRTVDGKTDYFFFLPALADDDRNQTFSLTASGGFPNTKYSLLDAPGFAAAQIAMGGAGVSGLAQAVMQVLSSNAQNGIVQVTPSQVIAAMAQVLAGKIPNASASALCALGEYGFSCLTNNPVLRGVEAAFSAMAEDRNNDFVRNNIISSVAQALQGTWSKLKVYGDVAPFQMALANSLNSSFRLLYNLNISLPQVSADGSSTDGGFQLYQRNPTNPALIGSRVATPQEFGQLVNSALQPIRDQFHSSQNAQALLGTVMNYINTNDFLKNVLWNYDSSNQNVPDPVANYQKLSRTPMQSCDGDNPFEVDDIDTQSNYDNNVQSYTPKSPQDLITWCLNLAKNAPAELCPMDSPQHAFNFEPANPDITAFLNKKMSTAQWIQNILVIPGLQVSRSPIDANTRKFIAAQLYNQIGGALPDTNAYQQLAQRLSMGSMCVKDFATEFVNGLNNLLSSNADQAVQVAMLIDSILLQNLSANNAAILNKSAIRFAFTNWNDGTKNIYFCAYFNPRTEKVGFGMIDEDKTNLQPMDETAWVDNQQWDVDLKPYAPTS